MDEYNDLEFFDTEEAVSHPHIYDPAEAEDLKERAVQIRNQSAYIAALENALCEQDISNDNRFAAIENALCELDERG